MTPVPSSASWKGDLDAGCQVSYRGYDIVVTSLGRDQPPTAHYALYPRDTEEPLRTAEGTARTMEDARRIGVQKADQLYFDSLPPGIQAIFNEACERLTSTPEGRSHSEKGGLVRTSPDELPYEAVSANGRANEWMVPLWDAIHAYAAASSTEGRIQATTAVGRAVEQAMALALECRRPSGPPPEADDPVSVLRDLVKRCRCRGTGTYVPECPRCADSTEDHVCDDEPRRCTDGACQAARDMIAAAGVRPPLADAEEHAVRLVTLALQPLLGAGSACAGSRASTSGPSATTPPWTEWRVGESGRRRYPTREAAELNARESGAKIIQPTRAATAVEVGEALFRSWERWHSRDDALEVMSETPDDFVDFDFTSGTPSPLRDLAAASPDVWDEEMREAWVRIARRVSHACHIFGPITKVEKPQEGRET